MTRHLVSKSLNPGRVLPFIILLPFIRRLHGREHFPVPLLYRHQRRLSLLVLQYLPGRLACWDRMSGRRRDFTGPEYTEESRSVSQSFPAS
jgi:hypothetical protein